MDACQGDSGGPLVSKRPREELTGDLERYEVLGVTSFGQKCGVFNGIGNKKELENAFSSTFK